MRIAVIDAGDGLEVAAVVGDRAVRLRQAAATLSMSRGHEMFAGLDTFLAGGPAALDLAREVLARASIDDGLPLSDVRLGPPRVPDSSVLCHVINYASHGPAGIPSRPFFFMKPASAVIGHQDEIEPHAGLSSELDWETELAVVIGTAGRNIPPDEAYAHVAGYTIVNDVSHRDLQFNRMDPSISARYGMNWLQGKGLDGSCPMGPWIVLTDELDEPYPLRIRTFVDGELRQEGNTQDMHFQVPALIAEVSRGLTLRPGDVIATGSPPGTGLDGGRYLGPGELVKCEIERIGVLENRITASTG